MLLVVCASARGADFDARLTLKEAEALPAQRETVRGASDALLILPDAAAAATVKDPRDGAAYGAVCYVYLSDSGLYVRRFSVHVPDRETLPFARRAGRFLALLWGSANRRFGTACARLRETAVDAWLSRSGEAGGEQFRNNLYLYDLFSERAGIEWARELAHEYGHYLLPGASGYTEPENWANGVLGERLFLKWLRDDLLAGRLTAGEIPFVTPNDMDDYRAKQVTPLIARVQGSGPDPALLARTDRRAMDAFTGLLLYADETWGSAVLLDMLDYLPKSPSAGAHGNDFLTALLLWADRAPSFTMNLPSSGAGMVYVPRGVYQVRAAGGTPASLTVGRGATVTREGDGWTVRVPSPGWRSVGVAGAEKPVTLQWTRR
jgi:hypothetical protein